MYGRSGLLRKDFQGIFRGVLGAAREGEQRCLTGKRWDGNALLIVVDAALDSIGLNYFQIIVPRVKQFYEEYVKTRKVSSFKELAELSPQDTGLRRIMNNERVWKVATGVSKEVSRLREERSLKSDFAALRYWAENADYERWKEDPIGQIGGVGLITFQYLRMQAGVDTTMPDKIVKKAMQQYFNVNADNDIAFIKRMEAFSRESGYSQILICWAIWLKESDIKSRGWERIE